METNGYPSTSQKPCCSKSLDTNETRNGLSISKFGRINGARNCINLHGKPLPIIKFRNVGKQYSVNKTKSIKALDNLNFHVFSGEIFALMGPSGAGKSTAVSIIMGLQAANSGKVTVLGRTVGGNPGPNRLLMGYMPQVALELGMYPEFTVEETFYYFGRQNCVPTEEILGMLTLFQNELSLPNLNMLLSTLSGGQQRLVCFATSIIHRPKLIILDEPTVGLDYSLKNCIWKFVEVLVAEGSTIMLVTHDADEAMKSTRIGLMRGGKMLFQGQPSEILKQYEADDLEDAFFEACLEDEFLRQREETARKAIEKTTTIEQVEGQSSEGHELIPLQDISASSRQEAGDEDTDAITPAEEAVVAKDATEDDSEDELDEQTIQMAFGDYPLGWRESFRNRRTRIGALIIKNFLLIKKSWFACLFVFLLPSFQNWCITHSIGINPRIEVGMVNFELPNGTDKCPEFDTCAEYRDKGLLSCILMNYTQNDHSKYVYFKTESEANAAIHDGIVMAYLRINKNFSQAFIKSLENHELTEEDLAARDVFMGIDGSETPVSGFFMKTIHSGYVPFTDHVKAECGYTSAIGAELFQLEKPIFGDFEYFSKYVAVSVVLGILWFFPLASGASLMISERVRGTYIRTLIAGSSPVEMLIANLTRPIFYAVAQMIICLICLAYMEKVEIKGSIAVLMVLAIGMGLLGEILGFVFGICLSDHVLAAFLVLGTYFPNLMLAGMLWPIQSVKPAWLQEILWVLPASMPASAFRDVAVRGLSITEPPVYQGVISLFCWILISLFLFYLVSKKQGNAAV